MINQLVTSVRRLLLSNCKMTDMGAAPKLQNLPRALFCLDHSLAHSESGLTDIATLSNLTVHREKGGSFYIAFLD